MKRSNDIIVGLDIGTTKTAVVIGEVNEDKVHIIGVGLSAADGLRKGVVIDIDSTINSIIKTVTQAEEMSGCEVSQVVTGISGAHIRGIASQGIVQIKGKEVTAGDVKRVIDASKAIAIPADREVIHVVPQEFAVDSQEGVKSPLGMNGVRLQVKTHVITGSRPSIMNIIKCCNKAGLQVSEMSLQQIASAQAVLTDEEKELGVALVDIGGGTTDIVVYYGGTIIQTAVIPIGGNHITNDIAVGLRTTSSHAEKLKKKYALSTDMISILPDQPDSARHNFQHVSTQVLKAIIEPRMEEIFSLVREELLKTKLMDMLSAGIVLTGGTSLLDGTVAMAEQVLDMPTRIGRPGRNILGNELVSSPSFATAVGLVLYGSLPPTTIKGLRIGEGSLMSKVIGSMKSWFGR